MRRRLGRQQVLREQVSYHHIGEQFIVPFHRSLIERACEAYKAPWSSPSVFPVIPEIVTVGALASPTTVSRIFVWTLS
jgi:hypothetical protein